MISPTPTSPPPTWDELTPSFPDRRSDMAGRGEASRAQSTSVSHGLELPSSSSSDGFEVDHESHTTPGGADRIRYRSCCQRPGCFCASASRRSTTAPARASRGCATPARRACCRDTVAHTRAAMRVDRVSVVDALQLGDESTTAAWYARNPLRPNATVTNHHTAARISSHSTWFSAAAGRRRDPYF
jgi:hypothetical protein